MYHFKLHSRWTRKEYDVCEYSGGQLLYLETFFWDKGQFKLPQNWQLHQWLSFSLFWGWKNCPVDKCAHAIRM